MTLPPSGNFWQMGLNNLYSLWEPFPTKIQPNVDFCFSWTFSKLEVDGGFKDQPNLKTYNKQYTNLQVTILAYGFVCWRKWFFRIVCNGNQQADAYQDETQVR